MKIATLFLLVNAVVGQTVVDSGYKKVIDYDAVSATFSKRDLDAKGNLLIQSWERLSDNVGVVDIYEYTPGTDTWALDDTIVDPSATASGQFGRAMSTDGTYVVLASRAGDDTKVYYKSGGTWSVIKDLSSSGTASFPQNFKIRSGILFACGTTQCRTAREITPGTFSGWSTAYTKQSGLTDVYFDQGIDLSDDGLYGMACTWHEGNDAHGCQYHRINAGSNSFGTVGHTDAPGSVSNLFYRPAIDSVGTVVTAKYTGSDGGILKLNTATSGDEVILHQYYCTATDTGSFYVGDFATSGDGDDYLLVSNYQNSEKVCLYLNGATTAAKEFQLSGGTAQSTGFGADIAIAGTDNNVLIVGTYANAGTHRGLYSFQYIVPPPTPAPTLSPTPSPTYECVGPSQCTGTDYCGPANTCETAAACTNHHDCIGEFVSGNLPHCDKDNSICQDKEYVGSCTDQDSCDHFNNKAYAEAHSIGSITQTVSVPDNNLTAARLAVKELYTGVASETSVTQNILTFVTGSETATFDLALFNEADNNTLVLGEIKALICGSAAEFCTVTIPSRRMLEAYGRELQSGGDIVVSVTYEIDSAIFDQLEAADSFDDPAFQAALAAAVGVSADNVTITAVDGTLEIEYVVAQESTGDDPLSEENLDAINDLNDDINTVTTTVVSELNLTASDISEPDVDRCEGRDCNGRGTCDSNTGICACTDPDYWGINCETSVTCNNGTKSTDSAYCVCEYPEYGKRCEHDKDCDCPT